MNINLEFRISEFIIVYFKLFCLRNIRIAKFIVNKNKNQKVKCNVTKNIKTVISKIYKKIVISIQLIIIETRENKKIFY